jgi:ppGpp synthetase/RelA/SpoT-type nucleotidyltranferase
VTGSAGREQRRAELAAWYDQQVESFHALEQTFGEHLRAALRSARLDDARVETRTKSLESFLGKATRTDGRGGFRYDDPTSQLTDFVGSRVLVPLSADVSPVARLVQRLYDVEEMSDQRADQLLDVPGYQSLHFLVRLRAEDRAAAPYPELPDLPIEVQVRSILQHAWAALQHDVMYKAERVPTDNVRRRLIALAGLLELADHEFMAVRLAHGDSAGMLDDSQAGGFDVAAVRRWAEALAGDEADSDRLAWSAELRPILAELGATSAEEATDLLGDWAARGPDVARTVRASRPWATAAYVADLLLRLSLGAEYLTRRSAHTPEAEAALARECAVLAESLDAS